jgi:WhiB family redox-sensing transcriptional regulator
MADQVNWAQALCKGKEELMYSPIPTTQEHVARTICGPCPIRAECLDDALASRQEFGVWGGTTEKDRRDVFKRGAAARQKLAARQTAPR